MNRIFSVRFYLCLIFVPSSRSLKWLPTERVKLRGGKIDEDLLSKNKRNSLYHFSWSDLFNPFKVNHAMLVSNQKPEKELVQSKNDLELFIESSTPLEVKGKLQLTYLNENFEGRFIATPDLIKLKTIHPFQGMVAAVAVEPGNLAQFLQANGGLSASGQQHIYFLVFDIFHLYNLFRLKPQSLLALYQEALTILKAKGATLEFGKIDPRSELGIELAAWLHEQVKQRFKHSYCSPKGLLYSFQNLLKLYPEYFIPA
ncbi:MAG: hypothetical protein RL185_537 [Bacteroidota bacterium]